MSDAITCDDCGQEVTLLRTERNTLELSCGCDSTPTRVSEKPPEGWSA